MGYQESLLHIRPQWLFDSMIRAYEQMAASGYYSIMGAEPVSVIRLKKAAMGFPKGTKLLWVCGDRCFHTESGVFDQTKITDFPFYRLTFTSLEYALAQTNSNVLEGIDLNTDEPSENEYLKRLSVRKYIDLLHGITEQTVEDAEEQEQMEQQSIKPKNDIELTL